MIDLSQNILYEDSDIMAINKPAGLVVHSDGRTKEVSVSDWLVSKHPETKDVGEPLGEIERPGVVHRIDRETSGVLLLAKTNKGHAYLKGQFQNREVEKIYHAFVYGVMKKEEVLVDTPIGRSRGDFRRWSIDKGARGEMREALTKFKVLSRYESKDTTLVEASPKTGRTHQIRVHLASIHHPVICDKLYASKKECLLGFKRLALHAREITFKNTEGERVIVEAPYPEDFQRALDSIG